jgi:D-3-phosphoglycerate dehydrogenase
VRHKNRPGVLAHVFDVLARRGINVEEVENIIYHGAQATLARIHLDTKPDQAAMDAIASGNADVIKVDLTRLDDGA